MLNNLFYRKQNKKDERENFNEGSEKNLRIENEILAPG